MANQDEFLRLECVSKIMLRIRKESEFVRVSYCRYISLLRDVAVVEIYMIRGYKLDDECLIETSSFNIDDNV